MARHPKERPSYFGSMSRRDFLRKSAGAAAGIPAASALLAACKGGGAEGPTPSTLPLARPDKPVTLPTFPENPAIASGLQPEQNATLQLYNWDQYIYKKVLDDFAAKYNCKYTISTFNNGDEALSKIRSGQTSFDVYFPTPDQLGKLSTFQLIQPINHDYIPNLKANVWPDYTDPGKPWYDQNSLYTVPYTLYSTGIGWRNDMVPEAEDPWHLDNPYDIFANPKFKGKVGMYDDYREAMVFGLLQAGHTDVNTCDPNELTAAKDWLQSLIQKTNVALDINGTYEDLPKGIFWVHQAWSGDMTSAPYYGTANAATTAPLLSYWFPKNGKGPVANDCMAILKSSKNPVLSHLFLNYMLDFNVAMKNMSWVGYQPPQTAITPDYWTSNQKWSWIVYPNLINTTVQPADVENGYFEAELDPACDAIWHDNWEQFTAGV